MNPLFNTDSYKLFHRQMYPKGTSLVYSNWTPRSSKHYNGKNKNYVVTFGIQRMVKKLHKWFQDEFFSKDKDSVLLNYARQIRNFTGVDDYDVSHIGELHDVGHLPMTFKALPEGTKCPIGVPCLTVYNTRPEFFWLTNYLETWISCELWGPMTSATVANEYREILTDWAEKTGDPNFVQFQGHDFSFRGMYGSEAAAMSGLGHLTSFAGTDTIPSYIEAQEYYNSDQNDWKDFSIVATSVPATEHSIQSAHYDGEDELEYLDHILKTFPTGIVSIVCDGFDFWHFVTKVLPQRKEEILARDGKIVVRPDCYDEQTKVFTDRGWVYFKDLRMSDKVAQVLEDGTQEFVKPLKYVNEHYEGEMVRYKDFHGKVNLLVTPNHRMVFSKKGKLKVQEAEQCNFFSGKDLVRSSAAKNLGYELSPLQALKIAFQADGSFQTKGNNIRFSFSKQRKMDRLESILNDAEIKFSKYTLSDGRFEYNVHTDATNFVKDFSWVREQDYGHICSNWCREFIEELSYWDATRRHENRFKFDTTNKSVIDKVEIIAMFAGYGVLLSEREDNRKDHFSNVFTAHILKNNLSGGQAIVKSTEHYSGNIYCVMVPSGKLLVKRGRGTAVCGNSGDPVDIICGRQLIKKGKEYYEESGIIYDDRPILNRVFVTEDEIKGAIECLYDIFGGTENDKGYIELDSHIGLIYGDSITLKRADDICSRLITKGFASTNVVLGIGSYTYQFNTRDTFGFAMKATYVEILEERNDEEGADVYTVPVGKPIFKSPKTGDGTKKSAKGLLQVRGDGEKGLRVVDEQTWKGEQSGYLQEIYRDGKLLVNDSLQTIRKRIQND